ncbi:MAG: tRNA dihydrouridine synthase DusB [Lachnospiraceae bacterium]|nr:tRNA dihydrouridine synthase DusB [Lachnospiraceae bacterium]
MLKIGNVELPNRWILAPMAGVCDLPFRLLCHEAGAGMTCMEMISAKAIHYRNKATMEMMRIDPAEGIVSLQLFGSDPDIMAESASVIEDRPFGILDINMGCPVPKVVNNGEGSFLMKDPKLAGSVIRAVCKAVSKPVTVKIRAGFDDDHINAPQIARIAEECGAAAVAVHARTRQQYYSGRANWDIIRQVKDAVGIPVIGNGDVVSYETAMDMIEQTGCDGVMIGRAAQGNPWIFSELCAKSEGRSFAGPSRQEVARMILRHAEMLVECKGEYIGIREMRKHAAWYTKGYSGSASFRGKLNEIQTLDELKRLIFEKGTQ